MQVRNLAEAAAHKAAPYVGRVFGTHKGEPSERQRKVASKRSRTHGLHSLSVTLFLHFVPLADFESGEKRRSRSWRNA